MSLRSGLLLRLMRNAFLIACLIGASPFSFAHGSGGPAPDYFVISAAIGRVYQFTEKDSGFMVGKLDASWKAVKKHHVSIVEKTEHRIVLVVQNPSKAEKIYFLMSRNAHVDAVDFSGEF